MKRVLVCGAGSVGRRHISNLTALGAEVYVWRARADRLAEIALEFPVQTHADLPMAIANVDAVVVATASDRHVTVAQEVLKAGKPLFIEKPLSHSWTGVDALVRMAIGKLVEIGCQFRAHPNLVSLERLFRQPDEGRLLTYRMAMGQRLDAWRPGQDYRQSYSADAARGGGAMMDLIHLIDLALWFFGPVAAVSAVLSKMTDLEIHGDDVANLLLTHESGVTGQIQLDMASPVHRCEVEAMTSTAIYRWSNSEGVLRRHSPNGEAIADRQPEGFQRNDLFLAHMRHFLKRLDDPELPPLCSLHDGVAALRVALAARESDQQRRQVRIQGVT